MIENNNENLNEEDPVKSKVYAIHITALESLINDPPTISNDQLKGRSQSISDSISQSISEDISKDILDSSL